MHDAFTTLISSQNHFVHLRNLSHNGFYTATEEMRLSKSKLYGHESDVVSNKMDHLQANISREGCFVCDRAAFTCLALIPGAGNNFKLLSIYFDLYVVVFHELGLLGTAVGCRGFVQTLN